MTTFLHLFVNSAITVKKHMTHEKYMACGQHMVATSYGTHNRVICDVRTSLHGALKTRHMRQENRVIWDMKKNENV